VELSACTARHTPLSPAFLAKCSTLEEVEPQLLVGLDPQVPLVDGHENGGLRHGVGGEMVELHLIVMQGARMNWLGGIPSPLSCKATKLTT
jgi:hypothetical protein